ncbi:hypothetical protein JCM10450v2_002826 [Rhodotorula kratochvilovae]
MLTLPRALALRRSLHTSAALLRPAALPLAAGLAPSRLDRPSSDQVRKQARERIQQRDAVAVSPLLTDSYGRKHDYLRISLTEKCNLRCTYCMPEQGVPLLPKDHLLTTDEVDRIARVFVHHGVTKIRLTGGEPTIRRDIIDVVERLGRLPLTSLGMTSNGIALKRKLPALVAAGLTHLNLSLDTLDPLKYELMTRRRGFDAVMDALEVAKGLKSQGLRTKLNVVVIRGLNDMEVPQFVELTRDSDITVRFIEYMPFEDNRWSTAKLVPSSSLLATLQSLHASTGISKLADPLSDTTRAYRVPGWKGNFGFISSMTDHFCGGCSRLRVGADGGVKVCLFGPPVLSLRPLLRGAPASANADAALMAEVGRAVYGKKFAHDGLGGPEGIKERGRMGPMVGIDAPALPAFTPRPRPSTAAARRPSISSFLGAKSAPAARIPTHLLPSSPTTSFCADRVFSTSPLSRSSSPTSPSPAADDAAAPRLTHIDPQTGKAAMVSVSRKPSTLRRATAEGRIVLNAAAFSLIDFGAAGEGGGATMRGKKGDVLSVAELAGLMGAKHTSLLIPLCHPLSLSHLSVALRPLPRTREILVTCTAECEGPTGVEMEALTGVSVAALVVWDMCKAVAGKEMEIRGVRVVSKSGGRSGDWVREGAGAGGQGEK